MRSTRFKILSLGSFLIVLICGLSISLKTFAQSTTDYSDSADLLVPNQTSDPTNAAVQQQINALSAAQQGAGPRESTSIIMNLSPQNPAPGDSVLINLVSYAENLDTAQISWYVNGSLVTSGVGKGSFTVQAPPAGAATIVVARVTTAVSENTTQVTTTIRPNTMVLLWQAEDSYVPPFYEGKALPTADTFIKVVAMPQINTGKGAIIPPENLTYSWQKDFFTNEPDASGFGKNYFTYKNDYLDSSNDIDVTASSTDQTYGAESRVDITPITPTLSFYREDPTLGIMWDHTLQSPYNIKDGETIVAAPYFISPKILTTPSLTFDWSINNVPVSISTPIKNKIPLKIEGGTSGASDLELDISNSNEFFETVTGGLRLQF